MFKSFFHGPIFSALCKTAFLWLFYACIPVAIGLCWMIRRLLLPGLPAAIVVFIINVLLISATYQIYRIWQVRAVLFKTEELPYVQPLFWLIPIQLAFVVVSTIIVLL